MTELKHIVTAALALLTVAGTAIAQGSANRGPQGGGVIYPAWTGEYFANPDLAGEPDYRRSDVRVRFDWDDWRPTLGVLAEPVRDFPTDGFSVRWTAKLIARFDEAYTFALESDEKARLRIRPEGGDWTTLIDAWEPHARRVDEAEMKLSPGTVYDVEIEYADLTGDAVCTLRWSSPSTPTEVVDYVSGNSVHAMMPHMLADLNSYSGRGSRSFPSNVAATQGTRVDAEGYPVEDFEYALIQGFSFHAGTGQIRFKGLAQVAISGTELEVDGERYSRLPKGVGYDPETNETRALVHFLDRGDGTARSNLSMTDTQRSPDAPVGSGVTEIEIMPSRVAGGSEPQPFGEVSRAEVRETFLPVFSWRVQTTGLNDIVEWDERTRPRYSKINGQFWRSDYAYEELILMANEIGRDLHLNFGASIDETFMRNLALLMKYGSDGDNPYTEPTQDPVFPPLNPNLRLYLEHGNEMGWSAIQPRGWYDDYDRIRADKGPIWDAINFDGTIDDSYHNGVMRYHAYRSARMSLNMRDVFGDQAMGEIVRPMIFGQYERWFQNGLMQYVDDYFNNPDYVDDPLPPDEIFWGAGPAVYYGTSNNFAVGDDFLLDNGNFESPDLPDGRARLRPSNADWTFEGNSGIVDNQVTRHLAAEVVRPGESITLDGTNVVGFEFTVGDRDLYVFELGRRAFAGDTGRSNIHLFTPDGQVLHRSKHGYTEPGKAEPGETLFLPTEYNAWATSDSSRVGVYRLLAGETYVVATSVNAGEIPGPATRLDAGPGLRVDGAVLVRGAGVGQSNIGGEIERFGRPGQGFPHATFRYGFAVEADDITLAPSDPLVDSTWPDGGKGKSFVPPFHREGNQLAFIAGEGRISQTFTVDRPGEYALIFTGNTSLNKETNRGENPFTITIGGEVVWDNQIMGLNRKPKGGLFQWGTRYTHLEPGEHEVVIETASDDPEEIVYFYAMHLGSMLDYAGGETASNFLDTGAATGQTAGRFATVAKLTTAMAQLWGVVPYAYEGGTQAGGDWGGENLFYAEQFKWNHPVSRVADNNWARYWHNFGGLNAFYYYPGFEYAQIHRAEDFMPWAAAIERARGWEHEPTGPAVVPATFTPDQRHYQSRPGATWDGWSHAFQNERSYNADSPTLDTVGQWKGFVFRTPDAGEWQIIAETTDGGEVELLVNGTQHVVDGTSGETLSTNIYLTKGIHSVRVRNTSGTFDLERIRIEPAPATPAD
jgi:hypothetical protein